VNRSPSLERFIFASFPVRQLGHYHSACRDIEAERSSVLKANVDNAFIGRNKEFDCLNCLAFHFREFHFSHDSHFDNLSELTDRSEESYRRQSKCVKGKHHNQGRQEAALSARESWPKPR
jgi:hypothetical protein